MELSSRMGQKVKPLRLGRLVRDLRRRSKKLSLLVDEPSKKGILALVKTQSLFQRASPLSEKDI